MRATVVSLRTSRRRLKWWVVPVTVLSTVERDPVGAEELGQRTGYRGGEAGVPGGVLRVVAVEKMGPGVVLERVVVPIRVRPLDRMLRAPEVVVVLGLPAADEAVRGGDMRHRHHPRGLERVELLDRARGSRRVRFH